jgi:hypothetical protein
MPNANDQLYKALIGANGSAGRKKDNDHYSRRSEPFMLGNFKARDTKIDCTEHLSSRSLPGSISERCGCATCALMYAAKNAAVQRPIGMETVDSFSTPTDRAR